MGKKTMVIVGEGKPFPLESQLLNVTDIND